MRQDINQRLHTLRFLHELKLIVDMIQKYGINGMWRRVSETARYGGLTRGPMVMTSETKDRYEKSS